MSASEPRAAGAGQEMQLDFPPLARQFARQFGMQVRGLARIAAGVLRSVHAQTRARRASRRMHVCETVHLGDKRIVALLQVDDWHILVGASGNSVSLLAELPAQASFPEVLRQKTALRAEG